MHQIDRSFINDFDHTWSRKFRDDTDTWFEYEKREILTLLSLLIEVTTTVESNDPGKY